MAARNGKAKTSTRRSPRSATRKHVTVSVWEGMTSAERLRVIPYVPVGDKAASTARVAPVSTGCACVPMGGEPGAIVWDGFNYVSLPRPAGAGTWRLVYSSDLGWTWEAVN